MSLKYNNQAKAFLTENGFDCEPEPDWLEGKVPDFFCRGDFEMWAEVKSFDPPRESEFQLRLFNVFKEQ
ncbi:MAG: hypothetical protein RIB59_17505, partial [Rhodospirillales bacterium]